jgi:hypothetical protein
MLETEDSLYRQAALTIASSRTLRAHRASLGRTRLHALAAHQELRDATNALSFACLQRREVLGAVFDRWVYVARVFPIRFG